MAFYKSEVYFIKKMLVLTRLVAKPEANLGYACLSAFLDEIVWLIFATSS